MAERSPSREKITAGTSTLDLALRALEFLVAESTPQSLASIAKALEASKSTILRHLVTLSAHGLVNQDGDSGRYEPAVKLLVWGEAVRSRFDVVSAARDPMVRLRDKTAQAVTLCGRIDRRLVVLELIQGRTVIEFGTRAGTRLDYHASAHGRIWLAHADEAERERILAEPMKAWTPHTIVDPTVLRQQLVEIRRRGWAAAPDEIIVSVNALAAPIFDHRGEQVGSLAIVGATQFIPSPPMESQIRDVLGAAEEVSRTLGWRPTP